LANAEEIWVKEIQKYSPKTPFILVGTKTDLRDDVKEIEKLAKKKERPIKYEQGERIAKKLKATKYVECSALNFEGIKDVFDEAIISVVNKPQAKSSPKCLIL